MSKPQPAIEQRYLSVKQASVYLGRSYYSTLQFIKNGGIPVIQEGKKMWLDKEDLDDYMQRIKRVLQ